MPASSAFTPIHRKIWRSYLLVNIIFALINGTYSSYTFLYLKNRLQRAGGISGSILDNLLFVLVVSMFFEFFAEPVTGDWADTYGRRRVIVGSFLGFFAAFLCYWLMSADALYRLPPLSEFRVIVGMSIIAELFFAISAALFNGALEAWFVDELSIAKGPEGSDLLSFFSIQRRWFGVFMIVGGVIPLWLANNGIQNPMTSNGSLTSIFALPWLVAALLAFFAALWINRALIEYRSPSPADQPTHQRIFLRLRRALSLRELRNALLVSSVLYTCWICFMYLLPVLLTEQKVISEAGMLQGILKNYYWYYLAMGASRFVGPFLSNTLWIGRDQSRQFRRWGLVNCGALTAAGIALLLKNSPALSRYLPGTIGSWLVPIALVLFWVTKVAEEAFKPVRSTYLNYLIEDGADRAFVLSLATPFGAVIILVGTGLLAVSQRFLQLLNEVQFSIALLFAILGGMGIILTIKLSHSRSSSHSSGVHR